MSQYRIEFDAAPWESPRKGARFKAFKRGSTQVRLVEFSRDLSHPEWCLAGHAGCVLAGVLEITFEGEVVEFGPGDGILIPPGEAHRHIPRAVTDTVTLLLVEEV